MTKLYTVAHMHGVPKSQQQKGKQPQHDINFYQKRTVPFIDRDRCWLDGSTVHLFNRKKKKMLYFLILLLCLLIYCCEWYFRATVLCMCNCVQTKHVEHIRWGSDWVPVSKKQVCPINRKCIPSNLDVQVVQIRQNLQICLLYNFTLNIFRFGTVCWREPAV